MNENTESVGFSDTNIKANCEMKWIHVEITFSNYCSDFSKTLEIIRISTYPKKNCAFYERNAWKYVLLFL